MRIDRKENIVFTKQDKVLFDNMVGLIHEIHYECDRGGEIEKVCETILNFLNTLSGYIETE